MSAHRTEPPGNADAIERAAAEWALRRQSGWRGDERREFEAWLQRDPRHAATFAEMDETSQLLDQLRDPALAGAAVVPFETPFATGTVVARRRWLLPAGLAAAAVLAIAGILGTKLLTTRENYTQTFATEVGDARTVNLPDSSVLRLNTDTVVEAVYTSGERRVRLKRGEAFFSVAKNPQRPFWVDVDTVSVRAVGTAFNVRFRSHSVEVLVKEGKVSVNQTAPSVAAPALAEAAASIPAPSHLLVAGEQATVSLPTKDARELPPVVVATVEAPRLESSLAWQEGRLEFTDTPLAEVVAEFNRYNRHQLKIDDPSLGAEQFGGTFASRGYEAFIEVLEQSFGVVPEQRGNETILRRSPASVWSK
jgi:transmembrane sensor